MALLSLGEFLWSLLVVFFMVIYFMMMLQVVVDVFRRHDASGLKKTAWLLFLLFLPLVGLVSYMAVNGDGIAQRGMERAARQQDAMDTYIRTTASDGESPAAEIERSKRLLDSGAIDQAEFDRLKARALAHGA